MVNWFSSSSPPATASLWERPKGFLGRWRQVARMHLERVVTSSSPKVQGSILGDWRTSPGVWRRQGLASESCCESLRSWGCGWWPGQWLRGWAGACAGRCQGLCFLLITQTKTFAFLSTFWNSGNVLLVPSLINDLNKILDTHSFYIGMKVVMLLFKQRSCNTWWLFRLMWLWFPHPRSLPWAGIWDSAVPVVLEKKVA